MIALKTIETFLKCDTEPESGRALLFFDCLDVQCNLWCTLCCWSVSFASRSLCYQWLLPERHRLLSDDLSSLSSPSIIISCHRAFPLPRPLHRITNCHQSRNEICVIVIQLPVPKSRPCLRNWGRYSCCLGGHPVVSRFSRPQDDLLPIATRFAQFVDRNTISSAVRRVAYETMAAAMPGFRSHSNCPGSRFICAHVKPALKFQTSRPSKCSSWKWYLPCRNPIQIEKSFIT
jgi:hypothetical protein